MSFNENRSLDPSQVQDCRGRRSCGCSIALAALADDMKSGEVDTCNMPGWDAQVGELSV